MLEPKKLQPDQWHVHWFLASRDILNNFFDTRYFTHTQPNRCSYFWIIVLGVPVVIAAHIAVLWLAFYVLLQYPFTRFGVGGIVTEVLIIAGIFAMVWWKNRKDSVGSTRYARGHDSGEIDSDQVVTATHEKGPSFWELTKEAIMRFKNRHCYPITLEELSRGSKS